MEISVHNVQHGADLVSEVGEEAQSGNNVGDCGRVVWVVAESGTCKRRRSCTAGQQISTFHEDSSPSLPTRQSSVQY